MSDPWANTKQPSLDAVANGYKRLLATMDDHHRIWLVHWSDLDHGLMQEWFESKAEAEMVWRMKGSTMSARIETVEIPKTRHGLVRWLNMHFDTDNG